MYGLKKRVVVIPARLCIHNREHEKYNVPCIFIFRKGLVWKPSALRKTENDMVDTGLVADFPED